MSAVIKACGSDVKGIFGGLAGQYLVEELKRGAAGNMSVGHLTTALNLSCMPQTDGSMDH
jgi:hypothetical protein